MRIARSFCLVRFPFSFLLSFQQLQQVQGKLFHLLAQCLASQHFQVREKIGGGRHLMLHRGQGTPIALSLLKL